jgi:hypothetical protein
MRLKLSISKSIAPKLSEFPELLEFPEFPEFPEFGELAAQFGMFLRRASKMHSSINLAGEFLQ